MNSKTAKYIRASLKATGINPQQTGYVATSVTKMVPRMRPDVLVGAIVWCEIPNRYIPAPLTVVGAVEWFQITHEPAARATAWLDSRAGRARYKQVKRIVKTSRDGGQARRPKPPVPEVAA